MAMPPTAVDVMYLYQGMQKPHRAESSRQWSKKYRTTMSENNRK